jgi:hypothetical protein
LFEAKIQVEEYKKRAEQILRENFEIKYKSDKIQDELEVTKLNTFK